MTLDLTRFGIVHRVGQDEVVVFLPQRNGMPWREIPVVNALADEWRLSSGDLLQGWSVEEDESGTSVIRSISAVNGLALTEAIDRPLPRPHRNALERETPERPLMGSAVSRDLDARAIEFVCPLGMGCAGLIYGPHGSGLTRTLQTTLRTIFRNSTDIEILVLLLNARGEEATQWRREFPSADVVECPSTYSGATADETVAAASLVLECAQRQTELGRHVFIAVDSLTSLWAAMLETEEADAQREADRAEARIGIRDWMLRAGNFAGEGLLGSGLGGSLTVVGTAWHQEIDVEAEEEGETHPHLRLIEHVLNDANWRLKLSASLAGQRLYPAIDLLSSISIYEGSILTAVMEERRSLARSELRRLPEKERFFRLMDVLSTTENNEAAAEALIPQSATAEDVPTEEDFWAGWRIE